MKSITLDEAISILQNSSAVIIDNVVTYPNLSFDYENDKPEERFLDLSWIDEDYNNFQINFYSQDNETVQIVDGSMFLIDEEGDECQLTILSPMKLT
jgi:hypothetical protein